MNAKAITEKLLTILGFTLFIGIGLGILALEWWICWWAAGLFVESRPKRIPLAIVFFLVGGGFSLYLVVAVLTLAWYSAASILRRLFGQPTNEPQTGASLRCEQEPSPDAISDKDRARLDEIANEAVDRLRERQSRRGEVS